jgi:hypothetical protein
MKLVHLIFYGFYKTASQINKIIPLKGGGIGGASTFLAIMSIPPFTLIYKFQAYFSFSLEYPVIILMMPIGLTIMIYFDNNGHKIIKQLEKEGLPIWQRVVLANGFLIIYTAAFIYF